MIDGKQLHIHTYQLEPGNGSQSAFGKIVRGNIIDECHHEIHTMQILLMIWQKTFSASAIYFGLTTPACM